MARHIKIVARLIPPLYENVRVKFVEQTHVFYDFAHNGHQFVHCEYVLSSVASPAWNHEGHCYVKGFNKDEDMVEMPLKEYTRFKAAVEAYNLYYQIKRTPATIKIEHPVKDPKHKEPWQHKTKDWRNYNGRW